MRRLVVLLLLATTGCSGEAETRTAPPAETLEYVAIGDSYTAAPAIATTSTGCFRSDHNYPHLLAEALTTDDLVVSLTDDSCSGATTDDVLERQLDGLGADTDLVTVGIGGNDLDLFARLLQTCVRAAGEDPTGAPCEAVGRDAAEAALPQIEASVGAVLDAVAERAPQADVVAVPYPQLLSAGDACPDLMPIAAGDYAFVAEIVAGLDAAIARAARSRDVDVAGVLRASRGHDICSDRPWVNGQRPHPSGAIPFHPLPAGQRGVADVLMSLVGELR